MRSDSFCRATVLGCVLGVWAMAGAAEQGPDVAENGNFDSTTTGWTIETNNSGGMSWSAADASGNPHSGSARLTAAANGSLIVMGEPCVEVEPDVTYLLSGSVWVDEASFGANVRLGFTEFDDASCSQGGGLLFSRFEEAELTGAEWQDLAARGWSFGSTTWLRPTLWIDAAAGSDVTAFFDELQMRTATCIPGPTTLCLNDGRFEVTASWRAQDDTTGQGQAVPFADESGSFWFFSPTNLELDVKVLTGCAINDRFWVFAAGLTNVEVHLQVRDTETEQFWSNDNPLGQTFVTVTDTDAFATCP